MHPFIMLHDGIANKKKEITSALFFNKVIQPWSMGHVTSILNIMELEHGHTYIPTGGCSHRLQNLPRLATGIYKNKQSCMCMSVKITQLHRILITSLIKSSWTWTLTKNIEARNVDQIYLFWKRCNETPPKVFTHQTRWSYNSQKVTNQVWPNIEQGSMKREK